MSGAQPQRILIDGYYIGKPSGFGRFIIEMCHALGTSDTDIDFVVAVPHDVDSNLLKPYPKITYHSLPKTNFALWEQFVIPYLAWRLNCDLVHSPYNTRPIFGRASKSVTTVHDLTFLNKDAERDWKSSLIHLYAGAAFHLAARKSGIVVSVSETTRRALQSIGVPSMRVYNSVDRFLSKQETFRAANSERPYFLHRGSSAAGHRNTDRVIEAFLSTPRLHENYALKILGVEHGAAHWNVAPDQPVHFLPRVSDAELGQLYAESACLLAPSLLEGFCLPIIEAFGFGAPVITSNIDPMLEIAGDAALLVDPSSVNDLADAMVRVVSDQSLAQELVRKGKRRLEEFSSRQMADQLLNIYQTQLAA